MAQLAAPSALAAFGPDRLAAAAFICAPSGQTSDAAIAAIEDFLEHTQRDEPTGAGGSGHCPLCVMGQYVLPPPAAAAGPSHSDAFVAPLFYQVRKAHSSHGPPLGQRAPPANHNA